MQIVPVASGKGGVGKSLIAANLSIALAQAGKKVVVADLDLGGSNLHTIFGIRAPKRGVGTFLTDKNARFEDIVIETDYHNLLFVPGDAEIPGMANLKAYQKNRLLRNLRGLDADYLLLDLGSGSGFNTLDFYLTSARGIIVTVPTLTAILNAYLFLKNAVFRLIDHSFSSRGPAGEYLKELKSGSEQLQRVYIPNLLPELRVRDEEGYRTFIAGRDIFQPMLIMNLISDPKDGAKAGKIRRSCLQYLGIDIEHLGIVYKDTVQDVALSSGLPIIVYKPQSLFSQAIHRIADKMLQQAATELQIPDAEDVDESYQVADMEAEIDADARTLYMEDLLRSGALTQGDLVETIRAQQYEINSLKKENRYLKSKIIRATDAGSAQ